LISQRRQHAQQGVPPDRPKSRPPGEVSLNNLLSFLLCRLDRFLLGLFRRQLGVTH
jgi:hypothetical protein